MFGKGSVELAEELIGYKLGHGRSSGIIVETEAYPGVKDPACHYDGKSTKRGKIFEKGPGTVYIFSMHGHDCFNFICGSEDYPEGVLIRAVEPVSGFEMMKERRGRENNIADGPGKLTEALNLRKEKHNGKNFDTSNIELEPLDQPKVLADRRIGISNAEDWPLRFVAKNSNHLSKNPLDPLNSSKARKYSSKNL